MRLVERRRPDEGGAIAVLTAVVAVVLLVTAALAVDIGNTWARRGLLQKQADQAALFAAQYLPANSRAEQVQAAKAAAYYIACHPVVGQDEIDATLPACPSTPETTDATFTSYAERLLADGSVSFPTTEGSSGSYVRVLTPAARVDFGLGAAAGASGSVQTREATARVGTPGAVAPMAMSLNCMLAAARNVSDALPTGLAAGLEDGLDGVLPMNYIAGQRIANNDKSGAPAVTRDFLGCSRMIKSPRHPQLGTGDNLDVNLVEGLDHAVGTHPGLLGATLPSPLTVDSLLGVVGGPSGPSSCSHNKQPDVLDNGGNHGTPNCVMPIEGANPFKEFTAGMLGDSIAVPANSLTGEAAHTTQGRLVCTDDRPCRRSFTLPGFRNVPLNDDRIEDFVKPGAADRLTEDVFFNLSTYLQNGLPVVTPDSVFTSDLYSSSRFLWMPVISTPADSGRAGSWPIVSFRPVFITQEPPTSLEPLDAVLEEVDSWVKQMLGVADTGDDHGLLLDKTGKELLAVRFVTIEPTALPAVPDEYGGPISDYVGTGVKVVRLVR